MKTAAIALLPLVVLAQQEAPVVDKTMDKLIIENEFMGMALSISGDQKGTLSADADGTKRSTLTFDRTSKAAGQGVGSGNSIASEPEWSFLKVHFCRFWIPVGAYVEVCNKVKGECYKYSKWSDEHVTVNLAEGEDGANKFASFTIDGQFATVELVVPAENVGDWDNDLHGVTVCKLEKGASAIFKPTNTTGRDAAGMSICGANERYDAVCHKDRFPTEFQKSYNVARLYIGSAGGVCTAWRVSAGNLMMTNNHCFKEQWELASSELSFNYQRTRCGAGGSADAGTLKVRPKTLLRTSKELDYTLFTLDDQGWNAIRQWRGSGGETIGHFELEVREPQIGEKIYIPQHGAGDPKQLSITDDHDSSSERICKIRRDTPARHLGYSCDTVGGSSGSPVVLRSNHKVIGLHNTGGCPHYTNGGVQIHHIWPEIRQFFSGVPAAPTPLSPPPPAPVVAQDCQGYWGPCDENCQRTTYYVTQNAQNGGKCPPDSAYGSKPACGAGEDKCPAGCTASCTGKECGSDGCGGSCGYCYTGYTCSSTGTCNRDYVPPPPPPAPVGDGVPTCDGKACNYKIVQARAGCPWGYQPLGHDSRDRVRGCATAEDECAYAFHDAIRARSTSDALPRSYSYTKSVYGTYSSSRPSGCFVAKYSSGEYVFWNSKADSTSGYSIDYIICKKNYFYGPGCADDKVSSCTPDCVGKQCGSDGCGGSCGACDSGAGETCNAYGQCNAPTCGSKASLCAKPGLKLKSTTQVCTKDYWTGEFCSEDQCCTQRTCNDAICGSGYTSVPNPASIFCSECDGSGSTLNPPSCCLKNPQGGSCPPDEYSQGFCDRIVQLSNQYPGYFCHVPDDRYTKVCKTSCHRAGYAVCGPEVAAAVSLAASQEEGGSKGTAGLGAPLGAGIALCAGAVAVLIGFFVGKSFRQPSCE